MMVARKPDNEAERLEELLSFNILDTPEEKDFEDLTKIASQILGTPIALVSLIDKDRQWFKSKQGLDASETHRDLAFCSHAILEPDEIFLVPDASKDERFRDNPLVTGDPNIRFYMGAPLVTSKGNAIGTLCTIDRVPRDVEPEKMEVLRILAKQTVAQIELRQLNKSLMLKNHELNSAKKELEEFYKRVSRDLVEAKSIQESLIPKQYPSGIQYHIHSRYIPIDEVGGDAIGFYSSESGQRLDLFFADVSGHGIAAALVSAMSLLAFQETARKKLTTADSLQDIHEELSSIHNQSHFISACYVRYYPTQYLLEYSYAGHHTILVHRNGQLHSLEGRGSLILTILPPNRENRQFQLEPGDRLILVSDGFFDIFNESMEQLGYDRLQAWILESICQEPKEFMDKLIKRVHQFSDHKKQDDMTILVLDII